MPRPPSQTTRQGYLPGLTLFGPRGILIAVMALTMTSCREESKVEIAAREKILLLGNGGEPKALDPHIVSSVGDANILRSTFEGLVTYHPENNLWGQVIY